MAGNALDILQMSCFFVSVSSSGVDTFVTKIKGMDQVAQKWEWLKPPSPSPYAVPGIRLSVGD